jgi:hypothetical protein
MMRFVATAADEKFKSVIKFWQDRVYACGLIPLIYDLGGLGRGTPLTTNLPGFDNFRKFGYYITLADGQYKSRAIHKPFIAMRALRESQSSVLYLDTDAFLRGVPTKMEGDWDVCVTVRPTTEQDRTVEEKRSYIGLINAGVIWFNYNSASLLFSEEWHARTLEEMNDQRALNLMCQNVKVGEVTRITLRNGTLVRLMGVPTVRYNNYYERVTNASVVHLKNKEWMGKTSEELARRCGVLLDKPAPPPMKQQGFFARLFQTPRPEPVVHHHDVYVYDDSNGVDLVDYYLTYRVLENLFSSTPVPPPLEDFVPPPTPDYSVQENRLAVPAGTQAEITEFPVDLADEEPTPATDNGS